MVKGRMPIRAATAIVLATLRRPASVASVEQSETQDEPRGRLPDFAAAQSGLRSSGAEAKMRAYSKSVGITLAVGIGFLAAAAGAVSTADAEEPKTVNFSAIRRPPRRQKCRSARRSASRRCRHLFRAPLGNVPGTRGACCRWHRAETKQTHGQHRHGRKANGLSFRPRLQVHHARSRRHGEVGRSTKSHSHLFQARPLACALAFGANGLALGAQVELECWAYAGRNDSLVSPS